MKTLKSRVQMVTLVAVMSGCASNKSQLLKAGDSIRHDVFKEVNGSTITPDKALLEIEFPVKGFKARFINTYFKHSDPPYTVTLNIDGQSIVLTDEPVLEELPGDFKDNPEAGTGWKYKFRKKLLLEPGKYHVTIAVPLSDVVTEKDVTINAGANLMQLIPVYYASVTRYQNYPRFSHGLRRVAVKLNNHEQ